MNVIGTTTTYVGHAIPGYRGQRVRIFAVLRAGVDIDSDDYLVTSDDALARLGGVTRHDRIDVAHFRPDGSVSFVHYDPQAGGLECFADLLWCRRIACAGSRLSR
jgi:hypothetical protein